MANEIGEDFMYYETTKEIWDIAKGTYSDNQNISQLFEVKGILYAMRQGELTVTQYFNVLNRLWKQVGLFDDAKWDTIQEAFYQGQRPEKGYVGESDFAKFKRRISTGCSWIKPCH